MTNDITSHLKHSGNTQFMCVSNCPFWLLGRESRSHLEGRRPEAPVSRTGGLGLGHRTLFWPLVFHFHPTLNSSTCLLA